MEQNELIAFVSSKLSELGAAHYVTGSVASGIYGESRTTNDVDIVADLPASQVDTFLAAFPADRFYVSRDAVLQAIQSGSQFNIIDTDSFIKVDLILLKPTPDAKTRLQRRQERNIAPGVRVPIASPED